jgi:hypothetical protein
MKGFAKGLGIIVVVAAVGFAARTYVWSRGLEAGTSVSAVVDEWGPSVAAVMCSYLNPDGTMVQKVGSGTFVREGTRAYVLTSAQAVGSDSASAVSCDVEFTNPPGNFIIRPAEISTNLQNADVEMLVLPEASSTALALMSPKTRVCQDAKVGDELVMLGYPFGGTTGLVAAQGIIGGDGGDRYYTATIEDGASGGLAIDRSGDCFLGMLSSALPVQSENLGQIVKWSSMGL